MDQNKQLSVTLHVYSTFQKEVNKYRNVYFGMRMEENRIPKREFYMNLESTRPRG
jgi:hypothetical protein